MNFNDFWQVICSIHDHPMYDKYQVKIQTNSAGLCDLKRIVIDMESNMICIVGG